jgi:uncharacterized protein (DUF111 family)
MLLMATVDDVPAEVVPYIIERVMDAGADNIHVVSAITKKNRMEYIVYVDVSEEKSGDVCTILALEFGTIGVKAFEPRHLMLPYRIESKAIQVRVADRTFDRTVRVKYISKDGQVLSLKAEYEDVKSLAVDLAGHGLRVPFSKLKALIEAEAFSKVLESSDVHVMIQ